MTKKISILKFEIISTIFVIVLGVILHFTFEWSNYNPVIGAFSATNESVWEHLKILFFPMLITTIIGYFYYQKDSSNYLCGKTKGIFLALIFIIVFYYTYSGILGNHIAIIDISSFMIATVIGEFYAYKNIQSNTLCNNLISVIILFIISLCFIIFTFYPPNIGIFKDPSTKNVNITD